MHEVNGVENNAHIIDSESDITWEITSFNEN